MARELAVASGSLSFTDLKALTPEVARELAAHLGSLEPDAVAELLPATAAILVKHDGALSLKSAEPGDESLLVLSAYRGAGARPENCLGGTGTDSGQACRSSPPAAAFLNSQRLP